MSLFGERFDGLEVVDRCVRRDARCTESVHHVPDGTEQRHLEGVGNVEELEAGVHERAHGRDLRIASGECKECGEPVADVGRVRFERFQPCVVRDDRITEESVHAGEGAAVFGAQFDLQDARPVCVVERLVLDKRSAQKVGGLEVREPNACARWPLVGSGQWRRARCPASEQWYAS